MPVDEDFPVEKRNIYLVGPMGSGKTTIGQRLARSLGLAFYDSDQEIESRTGASVNLIFDVEGENGFRERERQVLAELAAQRGVLVATGGGTVLSAANRELLKRTGIVVYLRTSVRQQLERLKRDRSRPLLKAVNKEHKLKELAEQRDPLYEGVADLVFPSKNRNIDAAVNQIEEAIRTFRSGPEPTTSDTHTS